MANEYYTTTQELTSVANAIRTKGGTSAQLVFPSGFVTAINNLEWNPNAASMPIYTYSGTHVLTDEGNGNWTLTLKTGGNLKFTSLSTAVDVFVVGGGGGGAGAFGGGGGGGVSGSGISINITSDVSTTSGASSITTSSGVFW